MRKRRGADAGKSAVPTSADSDRRIARLAAGAGVPVEEVLREVADFRLALETDMLIAAAALDAGAPEITAEVVDNEARELRDLHDRLLDRLAEAAHADIVAAGAAEPAPVVPLRRRTPIRTVSRTSRVIASAAAVIGIVGSAAAVRTMAGPTVATSESRGLAKADQQMESLAQTMLTEEPGVAAAAAEDLHETLQTLIDEHGDDPQVARQIVSLLTQDVALIRNKPELRGVLQQALTLAHRLSRQAPPQVRATVQPLIKAIESEAPKAKPSPAASSSPKATTSPSPSPSASSSSGNTQSGDSSGSNGSNNKGGGGEETPPLPEPPGI